jgi:hypothetical protein
MKKRLKKYQGKDSGSQVKTTKPSFTVPRGFDMKADSTIDPAFRMTDKQLERITGRPPIKNNDPGFNMEKNPALKKINEKKLQNGKPIVYKKTGGTIKSKKKK